MDPSKAAPIKKKGKKRKRLSKKHAPCVEGNAGPPTPASSEAKGGAREEKKMGESSSRLMYPYPTDYNDHFETPARAYDDIYPLLQHILDKKRKRKKSSNSNQSSPEVRQPTIYDPYYCTGRAATLINDVFQRHRGGSISIAHEKRDFYRDMQQKSIPQHDILVTNPPYSGDHKERCLQFAVDQLKTRGRPFFLLMPNYVATKDYFRKIVLEGGEGTKRIRTFYVTPAVDRPYEYDHPEGTGHAVSPFASVWFCGLSYGGGKENSRAVTDAFAKFHATRALAATGTPRIATSLQELIQMGGVSGQKRKNPRQRRKMRKEAMKRANEGATASSAGASGGQSKGNKKRPPERSEGRKAKKRKVR
ncbi:hypothetical protein ACHAXT_000686 [Thalassiosira profunda]